jgi:type I restriction enzyme S subunit
LVKDKKIKKSEPLLPVNADELPYRLPEGWIWVRTDDILEKLTNGYSGQQFKEPPGLPLTRIETISNGIVDFSRIGYVKDYDNELIEKYRIESKDILLSHINSEKHLGKTAVYQSDKLLLHGTNLLLLRVFKYFISADYFHIFMQYSRNAGYFISIAQHAIHQASINQSKVSYTPFALPPLAEQHRIVAKVDQLMTLCDELEARQQKRKKKLVNLNDSVLDRLLIAHESDDFDNTWRLIRDSFDLLYTIPETITKLREAMLQLAVQGKLVPQDPNDEPASILLAKIKAEKELLVKEKKIRQAAPLPPISPDEAPYKLTKGWEWVRLGEIIESMTNGLYKPEGFYADKGVGCLRMYNIQSGKIILNNLKRMILNTEEIEQYLLKHGDLVVNRVNSRELVGKAALVNRPEEPLVFESKNIRVRFIEKDIFPFYANTFFRTHEVRQVFEGDAKQTCGQASVSQPQIAGLAVPLPPLAEQHRIVAKVDQLMRLCDELEAKLIKSQTKSEKLVETVVKSIVFS